MVKRVIVSLGTSDDRAFTVGVRDNGRTVRSIELQTSPITKIFTEPLSYLIVMEDDAKNMFNAIVPIRNMAYLEYVKIETKKEDKPLELQHVAAQAGESDEQT